MESQNPENNIFVPIEPQEDNSNNINQIVTYEQHLHSTMYQLLHTAVGGIGDQKSIDDYRTLYYEDCLTYITTEDGVMLGIE